MKKKIIANLTETLEKRKHIYPKIKTNPIFQS